MKTITRSVILTIVSILLLSWFLPGVNIANTVTLILAGVVLAVLNVTLRPFLKIVLLPINVLTLGLFGWVINALVLFLTTWLVPGFSIGPVELFGWTLSQFWSLIVVSFALSLVSGFLGIVL